MTKFVTFTDIDGDEFSVPVADITLIAKHVPDPAETVVIGRSAKGLVITRTGLRASIKEDVREATRRVNA
jgi:hypothetical protein